MAYGLRLERLPQEIPTALGLGVPRDAQGPPWSCRGDKGSSAEGQQQSEVPARQSAKLPRLSSEMK